MPQPLKDAPSGIAYRPRILLEERPHHAARIGAVAVEWAALEDHLISSVTFALFIMKNHEAHSVAKTALWAVESQTARLQVIEDVLEPRISPEHFKIYVDQVKPEVRKRAKERNRIVHGHWGIAKEWPDDVILISATDNKHQRYSIKDFDDIIGRIVDTSNRVATFAFSLKGEAPPILTIPVQPQP